jgi:putative flippase GtrA
MYRLITTAFADMRIVVRYALVGLLAVAINLGTLMLLVQQAGLWYLAAAVIAFLVSFCVAFMLQKYWTFKDASNAVVRQGSMYFTIGIVNLCFNTIALYIAVDVLGFWYLGSQVCIMGCMALASFVANRHITFSPTAPM